MLQPFKDAAAHVHAVPVVDHACFAPGELADMASESLNPLRAFDVAHGAELMATLESYLGNNGSVAAVAEELTLHRNTVRYRLAQITELTGYDPAQTADRVQLWLALAVQRLSARHPR